MSWYVGRMKNSTLVYGIKCAITVIILTILLIARFGSTGLDIGLVLAFFAADCALNVMMILMLFTNSFKIRDDELIIYNSFKKKRIKINEISTIIVANNLFSGSSVYSEKIKNTRGKRVCLPFLALYDVDIENADSINVEFPLSNGYIDKELENNNISAHMFYGFLFKAKVVQAFAANFKGKLYIARTVYENFSDEIPTIYSEWKYTDKKIRIIKDMNSKGHFCNSPYLQ